MEKMSELDKLFDQTEQRLMGVCEDGCESVSTERWAEIGDGVRAGLQTLKQQIVLLYSSDKKAAKAAGGH
jgi:hypothetical protein